MLGSQLLDPGQGVGLAAPGLSIHEKRRYATIQRMVNQLSTRAEVDILRRNPLMEACVEREGGMLHVRGFQVRLKLASVHPHAPTSWLSSRSQASHDVEVSSSELFLENRPLSHVHLHSASFSGNWNRPQRLTMLRHCTHESIKVHFPQRVLVKHLARAWIIVLLLRWRASRIRSLLGLRCSAGSGLRGDLLLRGPRSWPPLPTGG
mmetsp:Transcript_82550/g.220650  ORF Transcript_82550/g.220650 Transcript_82550/m.220650 type:complete len:206 (+) Transcript_82550:1047-1664(+)